MHVVSNIDQIKYFHKSYQKSVLNGSIFPENPLFFSVGPNGLKFKLKCFFPAIY